MDIRFSHNSYLKLLDVAIDKKVKLLEVFTTRASSFSEDFVEYDTAFIANDGRKINYTLPIGKVIVLLLRDADGVIFTTIRRFTERKYTFYMQSRGKEFDLNFGAYDEDKAVS